MLGDDVMVLYFEIGAVLVTLFLLYLLFRLFQNPLHIIANSILGILLFVVMNFIFSAGIPISILSVGVVAIGGILGVILVVLLHLTGLGF